MYLYTSGDSAQISLIYICSRKAFRTGSLERQKQGLSFISKDVSVLSACLQTPNSRAWKGSNKFPSNTVMCLSAWKNTESQGRKWRHLLHLVSGPLSNWALLISQWIRKVFMPLYHLQNQMGKGLGVLFHLYFLHFCTQTTEQQGWWWKNICSTHSVSWASAKP